MKSEFAKKSPPELVESFDAAVASHPELTRRWMFGFPCTFLNGNMCTGLFQDRWFARLSDDDRAELASAGGRGFEPMPGRPMKEYAELPQSVLDDPGELHRWLDASIAYTGSLPPKQPKPQ